MRVSPIIRRSVCCLLLLTAACDRSVEPVTGRDSVIVTLAPQAYLIEQIVGERVDVGVMVGPQQSPEHFQLQPRQLAAMDDALYYFSIGMPFERVWLPKMAQTHPHVQVIPMRPVTDPVDGDPHYWTDPRHAMAMARTAYLPLSANFPAEREAFSRNFQNLESTLTALDERIQALFDSKQGRRFLVYHPAWSHFAARYGLEQIAVERDGKEPAARYLVSLRRLVRENNVQGILVQPQSSAAHVRRFAQDLGVKLVMADPLSPDYENNLWQVAQSISEELW